MRRQRELFMVATEHLLATPALTGPASKRVRAEPARAALHCSMQPGHQRRLARGAAPVQKTPDYDQAYDVRRARLGQATA